MKRALTTGLACAVLLGSHPAGAEPASSANKMFDEAKALRDEGKTEAACARFSESFKLEPGVGVALYLGDCYERLGRTASAWSAFREAQRIAAEHHDKRAGVAQRRADALEPDLSHLFIAVDLASTQGTVSLDGDVLEAHSLNATIPADPGEHVVTFDVAGQAQRVEHVHVEPNAPVVVVPLDVAPPPTPMKTTEVAPTPAPPRPATASPPRAPPPSPDFVVSRRWMMVGLLTAGAAGVGTGAALLAFKNQSMTNGGPSGSPQVDERTAATSVFAFSAGGAALAAAVIVFLTTPPRPTPVSCVVAVGPTTFPGGGGGLTLAGGF
jgi:hypothetical protein